MHGASASSHKDKSNTESEHILCTVYSVCLFGCACVHTQLSSKPWPACRLLLMPGTGRYWTSAHSWHKLQCKKKQKTKSSKHFSGQRKQTEPLRKNWSWVKLFIRAGSKILHRKTSTDTAAFWLLLNAHLHSYCLHLAFTQLAAMAKHNNALVWYYCVYCNSYGYCKINIDLLHSLNMNTKNITQKSTVTKVIVHLAKHFGNVFIFFILLSQDWCHIPNHDFARILPWNT